MHVSEEIIIYARKLLQNMEEYNAMHHLKAGGVKPELAFLAVKAAKILREPYVYEEKENRIVNSEDV